MKIFLINFMNFLASEIMTNLILNLFLSFFFNKEKNSALILKNACSLAVELGFGQKFKPDPRVDVRPGWTDRSSQPDPRVGVRRVLPSLSETSYI
jgi:hypothetical protein